MMIGNIAVVMLIVLKAVIMLQDVLLIYLQVSCHFISSRTKLMNLQMRSKLHIILVIHNANENKIIVKL